MLNIMLIFKQYDTNLICRFLVVQFISKLRVHAKIFFTKRDVQSKRLMTMETGNGS